LFLCTLTFGAYTFFGFSILILPPNVKSRGNRKDVNLCKGTGCELGSDLMYGRLSEDVNGSDDADVPGSIFTCTFVGSVFFVGSFEAIVDNQ
jgi:hypothetical protein